MELRAGNLLGDYEILGHIGSGGAGHVYKVRHTLTDRTEAIKILHQDVQLAGQTGRFEREIKVQASLQHPNIASVYNAQRIDGHLVMVMEYVDGRDLGKVVESGVPTIGRALDIAAQSLDALEYAHGRELIHRDIKPENILITAGGAVKLTDFGLVKMAHRSELTRTASPVGSVWYISPEQVRAAKEIDCRADLYSLGAVLYELVTGQPPFPGDNFYELMRAHVDETPRRPSEVVHYIPARLDAAIMKALEKDPSRRFGSAAEFRSEVEAIASGWSGPSPPRSGLSGGSAQGSTLRQALSRLAAPRRKNAPRDADWWRAEAPKAEVWPQRAAKAAGLALALGLIAAGSWNTLRDRPLLEIDYPSNRRLYPAAGIGLLEHATRRSRRSAAGDPEVPPSPARLQAPGSAPRSSGEGTGDSSLGASGCRGAPRRKPPLQP